MRPSSSLRRVIAVSSILAASFQPAGAATLPTTTATNSTVIIHRRVIGNLTIPAGVTVIDRVPGVIITGTLDVAGQLQLANTAHTIRAAQINVETGGSISAPGNLRLIVLSPTGDINIKGALTSINGSISLLSHGAGIYNSVVTAGRNINLTAVGRLGTIAMDSSILTAGHNITARGYQVALGGTITAGQLDPSNPANILKSGSITLISPYGGFGDGQLTANGGNITLIAPVVRVRHRDQPTDILGGLLELGINSQFTANGGNIVALAGVEVSNIWDPDWYYPSNVKLSATSINGHGGGILVGVGTTSTRALSIAARLPSGTISGVNAGQTVVNPSTSKGVVVINDNGFLSLNNRGFLYYGTPEPCTIDVQNGGTVVFEQVGPSITSGVPGTAIISSGIVLGATTFTTSVLSPIAKTEQVCDDTDFIIDADSDASLAMACDN
jgi:hypothetical protein